MSRAKLAVALIIVALIVVFFAFDLGRYLDLTYLKQRQEIVAGWYAAHPWRVIGVFFALYVLFTASSVPGGAVMTLIAGAIFGVAVGTVLVSFASSIGATLAFLASRFLFRDYVRRHFGARLRAFDEGMARDGPLYLFTLRLVPLFPFFMVNFLMGLTPIRTVTYYWVSQLGMLAGTLVYVNAGTQLARIESPHDVLSPALIASLTLLGVFPLLAKKSLDFYRSRSVYTGWSRPRRFDRNLVVIGAGSAGLVAAYLGAALKAKVTLIEKRRMGGDCLNTGCVPSKALISSARLAARIRRAREWGIDAPPVRVDFAAVMARIRRVIAQVAPHDSIERYTGLGVEVIEGEARIATPWSVEIAAAEGTRTLTTRSIVIAAGAAPSVPPIPGVEETGYLTSDTVWDLQELPARLLVLGGGPIGCELAQAFARLGSQVTQVEMAPRLLVREDPDASMLVMQRFREEGIDVRIATRARAFIREKGANVLIAECEGREVRIAFDTLLCALGRTARTEGYGLADIGVPVSARHTIETNEFLQTRYPNIYACGDVAGPYQFTHTAAHQAWYAAVNALFGRFKRFRVDYAVIPWTTFTEPEVARVGLNESEAQERHVPYEATTYRFDELDRAIADGETEGFVKVLTAPGGDRLLGATIVGAHAGELIAEFVLAMKHGIGLGGLLRTIHVYPTLAEANKHVAGNWRRSHAPERIVRWLAAFNAWQLR